MKLTHVIIMTMMVMTPMTRMTMMMMVVVVMMRMVMVTMMTPILLRTLLPRPLLSQRLKVTATTLPLLLTPQLSQDPTCVLR